MRAQDAAVDDPTLADLAAQAPNTEIVTDDQECKIEAMTATEGHVTFKWRRNNDDDIKNAETFFKQVRDGGGKVFALEKGGKKGAEVTTFDPRVKGYIVVPRLVGG